MSGLYQRALQLREAQRQLRLLKPEEIGEEEDLDASPEDREKILSQINAVVEKNRISIEPETLIDFQPKKKGGVLPLLFNLIALVIIAAGGFWLFRYFDRSQESIVTNQGSIQSAEGKLLAALKAESEKQLSEKDQAIVQIQGRLQEMSNQREQLQADADARIREREAELQAAMAQELETERQRLIGQGTSEIDINQRLAQFQSEQQAAMDEQLQAVRAQAQQEIESQQEALNQLSAEYQQALNAAQAEKSSLQAELTRQEASLVAEFQKKQTTLEGERLSALQELESLRGQQEREQLVLDQILSFYTAVQARLSAQDLNGALGSLNELESYLNQPDIISLEGVSRRRPVELFLIGSLKNLIAEEKNAANPDTVSLINSAKMLTAATKVIEQGNQSYLNGDYSKAKELYIAALSGLPAVSTGFQRLQEIEASGKNDLSAQIASITDRANTAYLAGDYSRAVTLYGQALDLMSPVNVDGGTIAERLAVAGYQTNRAVDMSTIQDLQGRVQTQSAQLEMLTALRAQLNGELESLKTQAASDAQTIAGIPDLENQIDNLQSRLQASTDLSEEQKARITLLNSEIERLTAKAEENARELLAMDSLKSEVDSNNRIKAELKGELGSIKNVYLNQTVEQSPANDPLSVLELLETKLVLRRIVSSEPVRSEYPNLYGNLEQYINSLVDEQRADGRLSTLRKLNELLDAVISKDTSTVAGTPEDFTSKQEQDAFLGFIDRLMKIIE